MKFTTLLRHVAESLLYFSQNTINFILLPSFVVQTILMFSINKAIKFIHQPDRLKVKYTFHIFVKHFTCFLTF